MRKGQKLLAPFYQFSKKECGCSVKYWPKSGCIIRHFCRKHGTLDQVFPK